MATGESNSLAEAIGRLAAAQEEDRRERRIRDREADPEFQAFVEARRRPLRKMPFAAFVSGIPELAEAFQTKVPGSFWALMESRIDVSCPCGATPHPAGSPAQCSGAGCPRWYVWDGRDVRVAFSPKGTQPVPVEEDEGL